MSAVDPVASATPINSRPQSRDSSPPPPDSHQDPAPSTLPDVHVSPATDAQDFPQSQPMTATASASSQNPNLDDGDPDAAPTYGTRSRNRPGASRPNYADDKELDMEIEAAGRISKSKRLSGNHTEETTSAPLGFAAINSLSIPNGDPAPPTNAAAPSPAPAPSKKRKQPGSSAVSHSGTPTYNLGPRSKAAHSAYVETNMMSFSRCGGKLNSKQQLVADDGTVLAPNGMSFYLCKTPAA